MNYFFLSFSLIALRIRVHKYSSKTINQKFKIKKKTAVAKCREKSKSYSKKHICKEGFLLTLS